MVFAFVLLIGIVGIVSGESNLSVNPNNESINTAKTASNLFEGVEGESLSYSEMEKEKGGSMWVIIGGALTAYGVGDLFYKVVTGRDYTLDLRHTARRTYRAVSRKLRSMRENKWRQRTYGGSW